MVLDIRILLIVAASISWTLVAASILYCYVDAVARRRSKSYRNLAKQADSESPRFRYWILALSTLLSILSSTGLFLL